MPTSRQERVEKFIELYVPGNAKVKASARKLLEAILENAELEVRAELGDGKGSR